MFFKKKNGINNDTTTLTGKIYIKERGVSQQSLVQADPLALAVLGANAEVCEEHIAVDVRYHPTLSGDIFLLCSDGLTRQVEHSQIAKLLGRKAQGLGICYNALLDASEAAGGEDNATVVLVRVRD